MISRTSKAQLMALCPGHDSQDGALTEALWALWAVKVLDAEHAARVKAHGVHCSQSDAPYVIALGSGKFTMIWWGSSEYSIGDYTTRDAARIAAAKALVARHPELSPAVWP